MAGGIYPGGTALGYRSSQQTLTEGNGAAGGMGGEESASEFGICAAASPGAGTGARPAEWGSRAR